ncbi:MAG: molybdopterin molybdotransferase MoeA [Bdellovibrionales bacterium]|nr:molybdopterin molybdotransferase MoeA [Bdellovibrionales bacterium]
MSTPETVVTYETALGLLEKCAKSLPRVLEKVSISEALGRILAADLLAPEDFPLWKTSAMDGYAVQSSFLNKRLNTFLKSEGILKAGDAPGFSSEEQVFEILTGAALPSGADAVVRVEDVSEPSDSGAVFTVPVKPGQNVRQIGEDVTKGAVLVSAGRVIRHEDLLLLATLGVVEIQVLRRLRVGLLCTGSELTSIEETPRPGMIRNSSFLYLSSILRDLGCEVIPLGFVEDEISSFAAHLSESAASKMDLLVTTGAVSVGKLDFLVEALQQLKARFHFQKVKVRPGKPVVLSEIPVRTGAPLIHLGLPGNPVTSAVSVRFFLVPLLRNWAAQPQEAPFYFPLNQDVRVTSETTCFYRAMVRKNENGMSVIEFHENQQPSRMAPMMDCTHWVKIDPSAQERLSAGTPVAAYPLIPSTSA